MNDLTESDAPTVSPAVTDHRPRAQRLIAYLESRPGEPLGVHEIGQALGMDPSLVSTTISGTMRRRSTSDRPRTNWTHVRRIAHGVYIYDQDYDRHAEHVRQRPTSPEAATTPQPVTETLPWTEVGRDSTGAVLRGPDGALYVPVPLGHLVRTDQATQTHPRQLDQ